MTSLFATSGVIAKVSSHVVIDSQDPRQDLYPGDVIFVTGVEEVVFDRDNPENSKSLLYRCWINGKTEHLFAEDIDFTVH